MSEERVYTLIVGSIKPTDFFFYDSDEAEQPLAGAINATLDVRDSSSSSSLLNLTSAESPGLNIDLNSNKITATLSQAEADALVPGRYVADIAIEFASGWQHTIPFDVVVTAGISDHL